MQTVKGEGKFISIKLRLWREHLLSRCSLDCPLPSQINLRSLKRYTSLNIQGRKISEGNCCLWSMQQFLLQPLLKFFEPILSIQILLDSCSAKQFSGLQGKTSIFKLIFFHDSEPLKSMYYHVAFLHRVVLQGCILVCVKQYLRCGSKFAARYVINLTDNSIRTVNGDW